jgi:copper transport protein
MSKAGRSGFLAVTRGYWSVRDVSIPYPGRWHVRVEAIMSDVEKIALEHEMDVPAR